MQVGALDALLKTLLPVTRVVDAVTTWIGKRLSWLILAAVVVSAVNATVRKIFDTSSNSWLELQWVLFSIVFLLCSPWTLLDNEHIRIDIVNNMLPKRVRDSIDVVGHAFFLLPLTIVMIITGIPFFYRSVEINEQSGNAGGLPQWPSKSLIMIGFAMLLHPGHFRTDQAHRRDARPHSGSACESTKLARSRGRAHRRRRSKNTESASGSGVSNGSLPYRQHGADHVRVAGRLPAARLSGGVLARRGRADLRPDRHRARAVRAGLPASPARTHLRRDEQRHAAGDPVLHLHGTGARTIRHGGGPARHHRAIVRHHARRPRLRGGVRRRAARRHHRRGRGVGDFDGPDLAADHAALRLRPARRLRRHRRLRHAGADHSAVAGADRDGRPARQVGRRHVRRRLHSRHRARRPLCRLCLPRHDCSSRRRRRACRRKRSAFARPTAAAA